MAANDDRKQKQQREILWVDREQNINRDIMERSGYKSSLFNTTDKCIEYITNHPSKESIYGIITSGMRHKDTKLDGIQMLNKIHSDWPNNNKPITAVVTASITQQQCDENNIPILCSTQLMVGIDVRARVQELIIKEISAKYGPISHNSANTITTNANGAKLKVPIQSIESDEKGTREMAEANVFMSMFGAVGADFKSDRSSIMLNPKFCRAYGKNKGETHWDGPCNDGKSRGGEPYYCPVGWKRYAIQFNDKPLDFEGKYDDWPIAYHATKFQYAMMITLTALKCSYKGNDGCHGAGVYVTPSIKYTNCPRYSDPYKLDMSQANTAGWTQDQIKEFKKYDGQYIQVAFACRIKPGSYKKYPETIKTPGDGETFDGIKKKEMEWLIEGEGGSMIGDDKILIYGIMIRVSKERTIWKNSFR